MSKQTVNIHGKEYETVASRVQRFLDKESNLAIITEIVTMNDTTVVMKASIVDENDRVRGTGHAEETRTSSQINRTSALENCETSAIGRALASVGYAGTEYASADEVDQAISQQGYSDKPKASSGKAASAKQVGFAESLLDRADKDLARSWFKDTFGNKQLSELTSKECSEFIEYLQGKPAGTVDDLSDYSGEVF